MPLPCPLTSELTLEPTTAPLHAPTLNDSYPSQQTMVETPADLSAPCRVAIQGSCWLGELKRPTPPGLMTPGDVGRVETNHGSGPQGWCAMHSFPGLGGSNPELASVGISNGRSSTL